MSKHTPGPWKVLGSRLGEGLLIGPDSSRYVAIVTKYSIGRTPVMVATDSANARLIAAAPELLAALKEAMQTMDSHDTDEMDALIERIEGKS